MAEPCLDTTSDEGECSPAKKLKLDVEDADKNDNYVLEAEVNLSTFEMKRILQNNCARKRICVEGTFKGREKSAIVLLEKKVFPGDSLFLKRGFFNDSTILRKVYSNNIYGNYECFPTREYNGLNATVIYPATPKHFERFKRKEFYIIDETYELYKSITLPHIESQSLSVEWINNILTHKAEQDNIVYEDTDKDTGFVLVSDIKWDGQLSTLKLLALPHQKIKSLRELNASHLPLLKNIRDAGIAAIVKKFGISGSQLRIYLHYQPSYYYLHVHFCYLMFQTPGIYVEKAHLLSMVINNLELMPDYYTKSILSYVVFEGDPLCNKFREQGILAEKKTLTTESTEYTELTESTECTELSESTECAELTESTDCVELTESTDCVELTESTECAELTESTEFTESVVSTKV